jgi:hypothetical protein
MPVLKIILSRLLQSVLIIVFAIVHLAAQPVSREYQIKAVFIFNFTQFVDWPATAFPSADAPLVIGVLGVNPFGSYLAEAVAGEKVNRHPVIVQYYDHPEEIQSCHILFVGLADTQKAGLVISGLKDRSILTISDSPGFLMLGGMVKFFTKKNNIRFEINPDAAKSAKLALSSKLLRIAEIFDPSK